MRNIWPTIICCTVARVMLTGRADRRRKRRQK
jgi:hypothetical protein